MATTDNKLIVDWQGGLVQSGLDVNDAQTLLQAYGMPLTEVGELLNSYKDIEVTSVDQKDEMKKAREVRLKLKAARVDIKKRHDELKADVLVKSNAIDFVNRTAANMIKEAEEYLEAQEKFAERLAAAELATKVANRKAELLMYTDDITPYLMGLGTLPEDKYKALLASLQKAKEDADKAAKLEAEQRERERAESEANRAKAEAAEAKAREAEAEAERLRKAEADRLAAEQAERERQEAEAAKAAAAPDKEKLIAGLDGLFVNAPALVTDKAMELLVAINDDLAALQAKHKKIIEEQL